MSEVTARRVIHTLMAAIEDLGGSGLQRLSSSEKQAYALAARWLRDNPPDQHTAKGSQNAQEAKGDLT